MTTKKETTYEFHLTPFEIGLLIGAMSKNDIPIRKELFKEIDEWSAKDWEKVES